MQVTKKTEFLKNLHRIWLSDLFDMEEYLEVMWMFMLKRNVNWKPVNELDIEHVLDSAVMGTDTEEMFAYYVNDRSKDVYENFARVCTAFLDFSKMDSVTLQTKAA